MSDGIFIEELEGPTINYWGDNPDISFFFLNIFPSYYEPTDRAKSAEFLAFSASQVEYTEDLLTYVSAIIDVDFTLGGNLNSSELTFGWNNTDDTGFGGAQLNGWVALPSSDPESSDIWLNTEVYTASTSINFSSYGAVNTTLIHEIGHVLGLEHPYEGETLPQPEWSQKYSVMGNGNPGLNIPVFSLYDIAMLQNRYGARAVNSSDSTYTVTFRGEQYASLPTFSENEMAVLIDSGGDNDAISAAGSQARNWIDLREGKFSTLRTTDTGLIQNNENVSIAFGSVIENAIGGDKNDTLIGNWSSNKLEGGSGNDSLFGDGDAKVNKLGADPTVTYTTANPTIEVKEADSDIIVGGAGLDNLYGGMGNDTLVGDGALTNSSDGGSDIIDGGDGTDTVDYSKYGDGGANTSAISLSINAGNPNIIDIIDPFGNTDFVENVEVVIATDHADVVDLGQLGVSIIFDGGGGNDDLDGGVGNDSLFGGEGIDSVTGGAGDDLIGNIHAPTFDYASLTPTERQAIIDSEDDGVETTLSGAVAFEYLSARIFEAIAA